MPANSVHILKYPSSRQLTFDVGKVGRSKHHVMAMLEADVTDAWTAVRQSRRSGRNLSFTAWLIRVIAECVAIHPQVAGINQPGRSRVLIFDDVDISLVVEKEVSGTLVPLPYTIRSAEKKSLDQIHAEIESAKAQAVVDESGYVLGREGSAFWMRLFTHLPQWLRLALLNAFVLNDPQRVKNAMGTVMVTTTGMVGHTHGWIVPTSMHSLSLAFGSLNEQPRVHKGQIEKRMVLHLTVLVDHDVVDGMPAARFVDDLVVRMESADGL